MNSHVEPGMLGAHTTAELRGDYSRARPDFSVEQSWHHYSENEHALWRRLWQRQSQLVRDYACAEFIQGLKLIETLERIPDLERISDQLEQRSGWRLVAVPGFIPDAAFFEHIANRRFPVTVWLRKPEEFDYLVEPDIFHDFFGHVPMLAQPEFAEYVHRFGRQGLAAIKQGALPFMARLYWFTVEFGLMRTTQGLRAYGAGILSSPGETVYAIEDQRPRRVRFALERCMRTQYRIDDFQQTYFVVDSLQELVQEMSGDLSPVLKRLPALPAFAPDRSYPGDELIAPAPARAAAQP
ncbi:MAG: phenylalanine 4-monooxygenase, partial [Nevskiales bacterium]